MEGFIADFSEYVEEEQVSSDDVEKVMKWTRRNRYVYLVVFEGDKASFGAMGDEVLDDAPGAEDMYGDLTPDDLQSSESPINQCSVRFADGTYTVGIIDYTQSAVWWTVVISGTAVIGAVFFLVMMLYYHRQTRAIAALSDEVESISTGLLENHITSERNDEIGALARNVDNMRTTILEKMDEKQKAWQANEELITSMSHDIRTPLTTLLGYIELLEADSENLTDEQKEYLRACQKKAVQIKGLSDRLLLYFWAYGDEKQVELEDFDARFLIWQLVGEHSVILSREGIEFDTSGIQLAEGVSLRVNAECLNRVFDNIFDNVRKYADKNERVTLTSSVKGEYISLTLENCIDGSVTVSGGTHVGLRTCENLLSLMHGRFSAEKRGNRFTVTIDLPVTKDLTGE